jgi:hypothetical protein
MTRRNKDATPIMGDMSGVSPSTSSPSNSIPLITLPVFIPESPRVWFRNIEIIYESKNILNDDDRFKSLILSLPIDIQLILENIHTYVEAKSLIMSKYSKSENEKITEALSNFSLEGDKPSIAFMRLKSKLNCIGVLKESVIKHQFTQALPSKIRVLMASHDNSSLEDYVKIADSVMESYSIEKDCGIYRIQQSAGQIPQSDGQTVSSNMYYGNNNLNNFNKAYENNNIDRYDSNSHQFNNNSYNSSKNTEIPYWLKPFNKNQRPVICRAHMYYGPNAKFCKHWCQWQNKSNYLKMQPTTPYNSRPSSPFNKFNEVPQQFNIAPKPAMRNTHYKNNCINSVTYPN